MATDTIDPPLKWHEIPDHPGYRAYEDGSIWSCWRPAGRGHGQIMSDVWHRLEPDRRKVDRRKRYTLKNSAGTYTRAYGSRFVLDAFVGPCPEGMEACHNDGDCTNDAASNLRWDTHSANLLDRRDHGTSICGEKVNTAKLTAADVIAIRQIGKPLKQHAIRYGVSETLISLILKRKVWQHV